MKEEEYQFILFDRVEKIKQIASEYDLENTSYVSHSGGKDSCVISALLDIALPNNKIPRVYKDTGIEYRQMRKFVRQLCKKDSRFIYIKPNKNIKNTLSKVGYPFKSKQHSHNFQTYKNNIEKCEEYKKKIIDMKLMDRIKEDNWTKEDLSFVMSMPKGVTSVMKYYFGFRVKEKEVFPSTNTEKRCRERERERVYYLHLSRLSLTH